MKTGQYTVSDGDGWKHRYLVYKVMRKTAEVSCLIYHDHYTCADWKLSGKGRSYRYPLELLKQQINGAEFIPFSEYYGDIDFPLEGDDPRTYGLNNG